MVDDEPLIVEMACEALEAGGYRVTTAGGGAEAIAYFQQNSASVDAVLLDIMMPGTDGFSDQGRFAEHQSARPHHRQQRPAPPRRGRRTVDGRGWIPAQAVFGRPTYAGCAIGVGCESSQPIRKGIE